MLAMVLLVGALGGHQVLVHTRTRRRELLVILRLDPFKLQMLLLGFHFLLLDLL